MNLVVDIVDRRIVSLSPFHVPVLGSRSTFIGGEASRLPATGILPLRWAMSSIRRCRL